MPPPPDNDSEFSMDQPFTAGVKEDIKTLLTKVVELFDEHNGLRYQYFVDIWSDMRFGLIFYGRETFRELYQFTEELFDLTKEYVREDCEFSLRVAGLYLLYALNAKQPCRPKVRIRLTLDEFRDLTQLIAQARNEQHWDLVYIWVNMLCDHAFYFSGSPIRMGLENAMQSFDRDSGEKETRAKRENPFKSDDYQSIFDRMNKLHFKYVSMKAALETTRQNTTKGPEVNSRGLNMMDESLPEFLADLVETVYKVPVRQPKGNFAEEGGVSIGDRRQRLREQAFKGVQGASANRKELEGLSVEPVPSTSRAAEETEWLPPESNSSDEEDARLMGVRSKKGRPRGKGARGAARGGASKGRPSIPADVQDAMATLEATRTDPSLRQIFHASPVKRKPGRPRKGARGRGRL